MGALSLKRLARLSAWRAAGLTVGANLFARLTGGMGANKFAPTVLALLLLSFAVPAIERHSDPDGCFSCHALPGLEHIDKDGVRRTATILQSDYYASLHGSVPCKDCHRQIDRYPHKPEEGYVDCSETCHVEEPSKGKPFTHKPVVDEFKASAHGSGHAPGLTKDFHGGNRLKEQEDEQNPSCRRCHSNTPYIKDSQLDAFKEEFHHTETECGTCHEGKTWRNQFSGHILRRLVGKNFNKLEANAMCIDCHGNEAAMKKVELQDYKTKDKKPADFRFIHSTASYGKTLHGRFLAVGDESGADCLDCHAPKGLRHAIQRDELPTASTHTGHLAETCGQAGCHGYTAIPMNAGFTKTDMHDVATLKLDVLPSVTDFQQLDSGYYRAMWILGSLASAFGVGSFLWMLFAAWRGGESKALLGHDMFQKVMLGAQPKAKDSWLRRLMRRGQTADAGAALAAVPVAGDLGPPRMTILYASQTGNGEGLAHDFAARAEAGGYQVKLQDMASYEPIELFKERLVFIICSTHGEGEPPHAAERLHSFLHAESAPRLEHLSFGVLALGDSSFKHFCKAGKDFDAFLMRLGAKRALARVDADADFDEPAAAWMASGLEAYRGLFGEAGLSPVSFAKTQGDAGGAPQYGKSNPYPARVLVNRNLNGLASSKETRHIEIDLSGSGLEYEAGDALGVYAKNSPAYVEDLLAVLKMDGYTEVSVGGESMSLREAFYSKLDITALSRVLVEKYAVLVPGAGLEELLAEENAKAFSDYAWGRQIIDLVEQYPLAGIDAQGFVDVLRRLPPRLYSISSSMKAVGQQVHLTVGAVRYQAHGRNRLGVCSTFLSDRLGEKERLGVFVQPNKHFRPPKDPNAGAIMVGPGTGIAPFRSFLQEREATGAPGKNWLFFGDQRRDCDFIYADELEDKLQRGVLARLDLAFSRDQAEKIYVQTRMTQNSRELYAWLEDGACFYVCGDASRMAHDVHKALAGVIVSEGGKTPEEAEAYLQAMADAGRYQRDVY